MAALGSPTHRRVVFLNGAPASGKTTVARAFQRRRLTEHGEVWLLVQLDAFENMVPADVTLSPAQLRSCIDAMYDAIGALMAGPSDLLIELVVRDDDAVREIVTAIRRIAARSSRTESWVTLSAPERVRDVRHRTRGGDARAVEIATRLDPEYMDLGETIDTGSHDVEDSAALIGVGQRGPNCAEGRSDSLQ